MFLQHPESKLGDQNTSVCCTRAFVQILNAYRKKSSMARWHVLVALVLGGGGRDRRVPGLAGHSLTQV